MEEFNICYKCSNNEALREEIIKIGGNIDNCDFCDNKNLFGLNQDTIEDIKPYLEAYVAYFYPQADWDGRYGTRDYLVTIYEEELFFNWKKIEQNDKYDLLYYSIENNDFKTLVLEDHWASPWALVNEEHHKLLNSLTSEDNFKKKLQATTDLVNKAELMIKKKTAKISGYRSRIGCREVSGDYGRAVKIPFDKKDIGVAPKDAINSGRANRAFCGFLYLAEDINTSVLEVRAQKGDLVSIGEFHSKSPLRIFDLTDPNIWDFKQNYSTVKELQLISAINSLFSKPIGNGTNSIYLDTQLIVEEIIRKNYDGICFRSSFTGNRNYTLFNSDLMEEQSGRGKLLKVDAMKLNLSEWKDDLYDLI